ncbi:MAG: flagellar biosynthesis protein FlhB [Candidatus Krumholzibacteriia bacterium]
MAEDVGGEKTEKATGRRREQARNKGQVAKSQEVSGAFLLVTGVLVLLLTGGRFAEVLGRNTAYLLSQAHVLGPANRWGVRDLLEANLEVLLAALAPLLGALLVAAFGGNVIQVGLHASAESLAFKTEKLNPITGMKKFFRKTMLFEIAKNVVKIALIGLLAWWTISGLMGKLAGMAILPLPEVVALGRAGFMTLMARLLAFVLLLAVIDWAWQKYQHEENLRMSKHEIKQENKELEGDPQIKARIRGLQFEMARKRMLPDVPKADVVITNPTHYAVALRYLPGSAAPVVVAKGQDHVAAVIRQIARKARVPVIENKPVARALYRQVEVGKMIPESLFQAVAEVLAYVYRLKKA